MTQQDLDEVLAMIRNIDDMVQDVAKIVGVEL